MKAKLLKYFIEIPFSFLCAVSLNPYLNVTGVEVLITSICVAFGLHTPTNNSFSIEQKRAFNRNFSDLFDHYKNFFGGGSQQQNSTSRLFTGSCSSCHRQSRRELMTNLFNEVQNETSKKTRFVTDLGELNMYMRTNFIVACPASDVEDFLKILIY